jgi:hypothetical protein
MSDRVAKPVLHRGRTGIAGDQLVALLEIDAQRACSARPTGGARHANILP